MATHPAFELLPFRKHFRSALLGCSRDHPWHQQRFPTLTANVKHTSPLASRFRLGIASPDCSGFPRVEIPDYVAYSSHRFHQQSAPLQGASGHTASCASTRILVGPFTLELSTALGSLRRRDPPFFTARAGYEFPARLSPGRGNRRTLSSTPVAVLPALSSLPLRLQQGFSIGIRRLPEPHPNDPPSG